VLALTDWCLRHGRAVTLCWLAVALIGAAGALGLGPLLSSGFALPGTDSSRVSTLLAHEFGDSSKGDFVLVAGGARPLTAARRAGAAMRIRYWRRADGAACRG